MITAHPERGRPCRPADLFRATKAAENLFGAGASRLSIELLEHIEEEDSELVDRIFERRRRAHVDASRVELSGLAVDERVRHLTELLDSQGFLADCEMLGPERHRINLHSCPIWAVPAGTDKRVPTSSNSCGSFCPKRAWTGSLTKGPGITAALTTSRLATDGIDGRRPGAASLQKPPRCGSLGGCYRHRLEGWCWGSVERSEPAASKGLTP